MSSHSSSPSPTASRKVSKPIKKKSAPTKPAAKKSKGNEGNPALIHTGKPYDPKDDPWASSEDEPMLRIPIKENLANTDRMMKGSKVLLLLREERMPQEVRLRERPVRVLVQAEVHVHRVDLEVRVDPR